MGNANRRLDSVAFNFTLVDAASDTDLFPVQDGATIYLGVVGNLLSMMATPTSGAVDTVEFSFDGTVVATEIAPPYRYVATNARI
jgi:hypothetical protein